MSQKDESKSIPGPIAAALRSVAVAAGIVRDSVGPVLNEWGKRGTALARRYLDAGYVATDAASESTSPPAIEFEQATVRFGSQIALQEISGRFAPGSMTAIIGPNGAGKSTLVKLAAGREKPTSGVVRIVPDTDHAIAFMPQRAELDISFPITVLDFVALGAWRRFGALATPESEIADRARQALGQVGLTEAAGRFVGELSIGNLQRVLFARLLLLDAPCILLDEPFAGIDEATTLDLLAILRRWHGEGRTIAAVLHDLDHVRDVFPECLLLARRVIGWGATAAVLTEDALRDARAALLSQ